MFQAKILCEMHKYMYILARISAGTLLAWRELTSGEKDSLIIIDTPLLFIVRLLLLLLTWFYCGLYIEVTILVKKKGHLKLNVANEFCKKGLEC